MKVVVLYSGGLDSAVVVAASLAAGHEVVALSIDYQQSNSKELAAAAELARWWGFIHYSLRLPLLNTNARKEIPARNTLFLAKALEVALTEGATAIAYGAEPDATYADSSLDYIEKMGAVMRLHGVELLAPVKRLAGKVDVLRMALDLGVPLDLVHSSLGQERIGARLQGALAQLFPYVNPLDLVEWLDQARQLDPYDLSTAETGSFKLYPALLVMASCEPGDYTIYTTGNWGKSLVWARDRLGRGDVRLTVHLTEDLSVLRCSQLSTASRAAQWGIKQALGRLPRPAWRPALQMRVTQGHLLAAARSLGYTLQPDGVRLTTERPYFPTGA